MTDRVLLVVYYFAGQYLTSPALGSAGELIKKIAYGELFETDAGLKLLTNALLGIALPGLFVCIFRFLGASADPSRLA